MSMSYNELDRVLSEVTRFVKAAKKAQRRLVNDKVDKNWPPITGTRETGAVKRASLDLAQALVILRKPS